MIRLAIVEPGQNGPDYASINSRLQGAIIVAVVGTNNGHVKSLATKLNLPNVAENLESVLEQHRQEFDAVVLHSDADERRGNAERAVEARKHVLLASPKATSIERADRLMELGRSTQVHVMVSNDLRHALDVIAVHGALESGKLGDPGLLRIHRWETTQDPRSTDGDTPIDSRVWRMAAELDVACWLFDDQLESVYAIRAGDDATDSHSRGYLQVHLGFTGGRMALIDLAALPSGSPYFSLSLIGSRGAAYADDHHNTQLLFQGGNSRGLRGKHTDLQLLNQLNEFASVIEKDNKPVDSGGELQQMIRVAQATIKSLGSGKVVWLKDDLDEQHGIIR